jgi:DNA adenine methylase
MNTTSRMVTQPAAQNLVKPFLKWAGGKSQLLAQFEHYYPSELYDGTITRYAEPFLGGGAVFIALTQQFSFQEVYLSDINPELILVYTVVQRDVERLLDKLDEFEKLYHLSDESKRTALFYAVREDYNRQLTKIDYKKYSHKWVLRAAQMIFLNKTCFNGLFRVNSKGGFNVPFGKYKNPNICDSNNLSRVSALLSHATLSIAPFWACKDWINAKTFVYLDPPYRPISLTSSFNSYASNRFDDAEQKLLAEFFREVHASQHAKMMLSNSDPTSINPDDDFFEQLYRGFNIHRVWASRMINSNADKRGKITELLITNY